MGVVLVLLPFVLIGAAVLFIAFSGGPAAAREAYLTRGGKAFRVVVPLLYIGLGEAEGGVGRLEQSSLSDSEEHGKELFRETCASCHNLDAVNARGVTGPDLDELGSLNQQRVLSAIRNGGTGQRRMPAGLLQGKDARDVALYVSRVAGQ
jgi:mono/diheme cytochrome c family protein